MLVSHFLLGQLDCILLSSLPSLPLTCKAFPGKGSGWEHARLYIPVQLVSNLSVCIHFQTRTHTPEGKENQKPLSSAERTQLLADRSGRLLYDIVPS